MAAPRRFAVGVGLAAALSVALQANAAQQKPLCQLAEALVGSVGSHLVQWDEQLEIGLNSTLNCSTFLEFVYLSRDTIRQQLDYIRGNFSQEDKQFKAMGKEGGSTSWAMTHMSTAASLVSAHLHIHGVLAAARPECLSENLQLLFLMSMRRLKSLLYDQLRHLWIVLQGTAEWFRQGAGRWLTEIVELFDADLRTMETIMVSWEAPANEESFASGQGSFGATRPGPPLPIFTAREDDGVSLSTIEILRRDMFQEWDLHKPMLRLLLRHVLPRDGSVADFCAGSGQVAEFLNDTGLLTAYAFDPSSNIRLLSRGVVDSLQIHAGPVRLWRNFDLMMCLSAAEDFRREGLDVWPQVWQNINAHADRGAVLSCGIGEERQHVVAAAAAYAPSFQLDEQLSESLRAASGDNVCIFWRRSDA